MAALEESIEQSTSECLRDGPEGRCETDLRRINVLAPDLPPEPGRHATFARDHEYKRHGTVSLLAGIDLPTGQVHALVRDRHRSREFVEFLQLSTLPTRPIRRSS